MFLPVVNPCEQISIHALREEGDPEYFKKSLGLQVFLSTPSARRATAGCRRPCGSFGISIHALREEGDEGPNYCHFPLNISIHALREEGDLFASRTLSNCSVISIHALREEGDSKNGEKHLRFCFIIKRSAQIWKSFSKNIQKNSCDLHRTA